MCFRDVVRRLFGEGIRVSDTQVRWAIATGRLPRPPLDGSLRYVFGDEHLEVARRIFRRNPCRRMGLQTKFNSTAWAAHGEPARRHRAPSAPAPAAIASDPRDLDGAAASRETRG